MKLTDIKKEIEVIMSEITRVTKIENSTINNINAGKRYSGTEEFSSYLNKCRSMDSIFEEAADKYNIPSALLKAIGRAESNFNAKAVSRCGAQGVMQLMPATARELGVDDAFDAEQNIMGGAKYIASLLKKYEGNTKLALAAYNAGSGNVAKYGGIPPFSETQNYVKKVMGYYENGSVTITQGVNSGTAVSAKEVPVQKNLSFLMKGETDQTDETDLGIDDLMELFTYDDYMKFIDILLSSDITKGDE